MARAIEYTWGASGKGHAACDAHLVPMLEDMDGRVVRVRRVTAPRQETFRCACGESATWFLNEVEAVITNE